MEEVDDTMEQHVQFLSIMELLLAAPWNHLEWGEGFSAAQGSQCTRTDNDKARIGKNPQAGVEMSGDWTVNVICTQHVERKASSAVAILPLFFLDSHSTHM